MALVAIAGSSVVGARRFAWAESTTTETVEVETAYGRLRGRRNGDLITFKSIPYAGPVSGENRFKAPPPLVPWTGIRDAFSPGPPSFQPSRPSFGSEEPFPSENCLVLNVWTPANDHRRRPVMFYNHGGGFTIGSGSTWYRMAATSLDSTTLLLWQAIIVWDFWDTYSWLTSRAKSMPLQEIKGYWTSRQHLSGYMKISRPLAAIHKM